MQRLSLRSAVLPSMAGSSVRSFYDKIRGKREGSDLGPETMFEDFAKSPHRQRVPQELHKTNRDAVQDAEKLNKVFLGILFVTIAGGMAFIDPFNGDQYRRPEGYGYTLEEMSRMERNKKM